MAPILCSPPLECNICETMQYRGCLVQEGLKLKLKEPVQVVSPPRRNTDFFGSFQSQLYSHPPERNEIKQKQKKFVRLWVTQW